MIDNRSKWTCATELAEVCGWQILPLWWIDGARCACGSVNCDSPGKHPIAQLAHRGLRNATSDLDVIRDWWRQYPKANVGARTGDRFWVLDLDGLSGIRAFAQIEEKHDDLPEVPAVRTGGGGRHLFFAADDRIKNKAKIGGDPIDCRGYGGYVVVPPSNHVSGNIYAWELLPTKYECEPAPGWLLDFVTGKGNGKPAGMTFAFEGDLESHPGVEKGERNCVLCRLVGSYLGTNSLTDDLLPLAIAWGERCRPPLPQKQVHRTVVALAQKHFTENPARPIRRLSLTPFSDIEPEPVRWLWRERIPSGKLSLLIGDPGVGKSHLSIDIAARVSSGQSFPDGAPCDRGKVLYYNLEDGSTDTVRPRLDAAGADVSQVINLEGIDRGGSLAMVTLDQHLPLIEVWLGETEGVRLVIIDPINAALGEVDSHKNAEVRGVLAPLAKLAEKFGVAVLAHDHLTKDSRRKAIYRSLGSIGFVGAARAVWAVSFDPDEEGRRLFLPIKQNLSQASGLAFRVVDSDRPAKVKAACIEWEPGPVLVAMDDLNGDEDGTPREEAKEWLRSMLADGPAPANTILKQAKTDGICERTLKTAKKELRVRSEREGASWVWCFPDNVPTTPDSPITNDQEYEI